MRSHELQRAQEQKQFRATSSRPPSQRNVFDGIAKLGELQNVSDITADESGAAGRGCSQQARVGLSRRFGPTFERRPFVVLLRMRPSRTGRAPWY